MKKLLLASALLAVPACIVRLGGDGDWSWDGPHVGHSNSTTTINGHRVELNDDVLSVDGVELHHSHWVDATLAAAPGESLHVNTANGPVVLDGVAGQGRFRALVWSEYEGDGSVSIEKGELVAQGHGAVLIDEVRGTLPAGVALRVNSSCGAIQLNDFAGATGLDANSGTGDVRLNGCSGSVRVQTGTGDVLVMSGTGPQLDIDSGTGDIECTGANFDQVHLSSGTGDLTVSGCAIKRLQADSGTGDATIRGGKIEELHHSLGVGEISWH